MTFNSFNGDKPMENSAWGYYASFKIGAEWIDKQEALVVTVKRGMEKIDFLRMFMNMLLL